jgi:polar amino acid transport system substrate-binding protein
MRRSLFYALALTPFLGPLLFSLSTPARAETVLEQIRNTGVLTAGTSIDAIPFGFRDAEGDWMGYSLDMLEQIRADVEAAVGRPVTLELVEVSVQNWIPRVSSGEVQVVCSSTSYTFNRSLEVEFSVPYFITGTQLLVRREFSDISRQLRIGVIPNTTNEGLIKAHLSFARFVPVENRAVGFAALQDGHIHALASDGILLEGLRVTSSDPDLLRLMPSTPYDQEMYGCLLPLDDEPFQQLVNRSLLEFMEQVVGNQEEAVTIFNTWFGPEGLVPIEQSLILSFFQAQVNQYSQQLGQ